MESSLIATPKRRLPLQKHIIMTYRSRSVHPFFHSSPFYPTPKFYALQCFVIGQTPQSSPCRGCMCIPSNTWFPGSDRLSISKCIFSRFSTAHGMRERVPMLYNVPPLFPSKFLDPRLVYGCLGQPESRSRMASRLVQPLFQGSRSWQTDRPSYLSNSPHKASAAMRPNNVQVYKTAHISYKCKLSKSKLYSAYELAYRRVEPRPKLTRTENFVKFGMQFLRYASWQTDSYAHCNT